MKKLGFTLIVLWGHACLAQDTGGLWSAHVGVGVGTIRANLSPHLDAMLLLSPAKTVGSEQFGLWLRSTYSYAGKPSGEVNSFLSLFWVYGRSDNSDKGVGLGYLIKKEGSTFANNVFVASYYVSQISRGVSVVPELIFNDDFREPIPSLRVSVLF